MRVKKNRGLEAKRQMYGYTFVAHWILGLVLFFIIPFFESIWYSFSSIKVEESGFITTFVGLKNFKQILFEDPDYLDNLVNSVTSLIYSLPMIIALSLILAVLLNKKFFGRTVIRAIFFLPVIISSSVIVLLLSDSSVNTPIFNMTATGEGVFDYDAILGSMNLPSQITSVMIFLLSNSISLTWSCGIQTILFMAGLQGIPDSFYEVSRIEGANKWQEFWMITIPMLRNILSLVIIYTMIALFTASNNKIMINAIAMMREMNYESVSAMLWFFFIIIIAVIGICLALYNKLCVRRWE